MSIVPASSLLTAPATRGAVLTKSDTVVLDPPLRGIYIGGTGDITVHFVGAPAAEYCLFSACPAGTFLPLAIDQLRSTNTSATLITGVW